MDMHRELPELLSLLYSAPLAAANWRQLVDRLCGITAARYGALLTVDSGNTPHMDVGYGAGFDPAIVESYNAHFNRLDPYRAPVLRNPRVGVIRSDELIPRPQLRQTQFYHEFFAPLDMECSTISVFTADPQRLEVLSLVSSRDGEAIIGASTPLLETLLPHLRTAFALRRALVQQTARAERAEAALDQVTYAAFLLDAAGRVRHHNAAAAAMIRREHDFGIRGDRLWTSSCVQQSRLNGLIARAARVGAAIADQPGGVMLLWRPGRQQLQVRVFPLRAGNGPGRPTPVLVTVTDPEQATVHPAELLQLLYGFTASEAQVAGLLAAGWAAERVAEQRAVSLGTVRVQIKSLLLKAGVRRQVDLVRLLLTLPGTAGTVRPAP
ncbi:MAG TPA: hypothetical protein VMB48_11660 [Steroidobacteraceae bacterium]|nr:hypothetical protein [Steroidobacteraceae bacterium]